MSIPKKIQTQINEIIAEQKVALDTGALPSAFVSAIAAADHGRRNAEIVLAEFERTGRKFSSLYPEEMRELAEAAAQAGKFWLAYRYAKSSGIASDQAKEYLGILMAIFRDDTEPVCEHDRRSFFSFADVFSYKHGETVSVIKCAECGCMNAVPAPDWLTRQRERRQEARALVPKGTEPDRAKAFLSKLQSI